MNQVTPTPGFVPPASGKLRALAAVCLALALLAGAGAVAWSVALRASGSVAGRRTASAAPAALSPATAVRNWRQVGASLEGRPILEATFGSGERRVLMIGGIHGSEFGSDIAEQFAAWLGANPAAIPAGSRVDVVVCANPDGRAAGRKGNAHAVNLNGNFPTRNWKQQRYASTTAGPHPGSEPETQVLMRVLAAARYSRVVSLHSQGGFIDYDGPGGLALATQVAGASGMPVKKLGPPSLYAGSLGTYVPERFGVPVLTIELSSRELTPELLAGLLASVRYAG